MASLGDAFVNLRADGSGFGAQAKAAIARTKLDASVLLTANTARADAAIARLTSKKNQIKLGVDVSSLSSALSSLKTKIAQAGIADIADVNIPIGKIRTQLVNLKRIISQVGISDILDVNVDTSKLTSALKNAAAEKTTITATVDTADAEAALGSLKAQLASLPSETIKVNVNDKGAFDNLAGDIRTAGESIGTSLDDGIRSGMESDKMGWLHDIEGRLIKGLKDDFGIHSPAASTIPIGQSLMQGIQSGMQSGLNSVLSAAKDIGAKIANALSSSSSSSSKSTGSKAASGALGAASNALNSGGVAGGALPGIAGVSGMQASIAGLAGIAISVLPAITAVAGGLATLVGGFAALMVTDAKFAAAIKTDFGSMESVIASAVKPLAGPMLAAFSQLTDFVKQIGPQLKTLFTDAGPLLQPLVKGFEGLVSGALPGFIAMIKAAQPVFATLSGAFTDLGKSLGIMFGDFAQAEGPSAVVLKSILDLVNTLFPILGELGKVFATAIAPAIASFGSALDQVLPALLPLGSIIAQLAGAALTDLASILSALGGLLVKVAPSFTALAKAAGSVFTAMENDGVFASVANAIEGLSTPIANLINALVKGLVPVLPQVVSLFSQVAGVVTSGLVTVLSGIAGAMTSLIKSLPPGVIEAIAIAFVGWKVIGAVSGMLSGLLGVVTGVIDPLLKMAKAIGLVDVAMDANPIGIVVLAIAALGVAFYLAWEKSAGFRDFIKTLGSDVLGAGIVVVQGFKEITDAFLGMVGTILHGLVDAFGWIPGLGPKLKTASAAFDGFKGSVDNAFTGIIKTMQGWQGELGASQQTVSAVTASIMGDFSKQHTAANRVQGDIDGLATAIGTYGATSNQYKAARQQLITDLENSGVKAGTAKTDVDNYSTAVQKNGTESKQAQAARQQLILDVLNTGAQSKIANTAVGNYTNAIKNNGINSDQAKAARQQLITDLENAGVNSKTAKTDVDNYSTAVKNNGVNSDQAKAARQQLITDILNATGNAKTGKTAIDNLTTAIQKHGTTSDAYKKARAQLITDLENAGLNAKTATGLVDGLTKSIQKLPAKTTIGVYVQGQGAWTITQGSLQQKLTAGTKFQVAGGGVLPGYAPGRDTVAAMLSPGEGILVPEAVQAIGPKNVMAINHMYSSGRTPGSPGHFAAGGVVTNTGGGFGAMGPWVNTEYGNTVAFDVNAVTKAMTAAINAAVAAAQASNIPYLGTDLPPIATMIKYFGPINDPSHETNISFAGHPLTINKVLASNAKSLGGQMAGAGYSSYIRDVGGFRTSKGASGSPIPYSMHQFGAAFDINEDGGPNGNWQTMTLPAKMVSLAAAARWFNGQAWGGASRDGGHFQFMGGGAANGGGGVPGTSGNVVSWLTTALKDTSEPASWLPALEEIVSKESGGNPNAYNPSGAAGLMQVMPGTYSEFASVPGGVYNPVSNAVAAIRYIASQYGNPNNIPNLYSSNYKGYSGGGMVFDQGGTIPPGRTMVWNRTGHDETLAPVNNAQPSNVSGGGGGGNGMPTGGELAIIRELRALQQVAARQGRDFGEAINASTAAGAFRSRYSRGGA